MDDYLASFDTSADSFEIPLPGIREHDAMRGAVKQAETERVLQVFHMLADHRRRCAQVRGSFRKAPSLRHPHKKR